MSGEAPSPNPLPQGRRVSSRGPPPPLAGGGWGEGAPHHERIRRPVPARDPRTHRDLDAFVVAARFDRAGTTAGLRPRRRHSASGRDRRPRDLAHRRSARRRRPLARTRCRAHRPASSPAATTANSAASPASGAASTIADFRSKWVEHVASHPGEKGKGLLACAVGKFIHLFDHTGEKLKELPHPSAVTGLAFDARGKRIGGVALQRRHAVVRRGQGGQPAQAGMEGQPHRDRHPSGRRRRGDRDAGERAAWLAAVRQPAHAHERLSGEDRGAVVHPQRQVAGHQRRGRDGAVAVLRRRPDGQGADRTGRRRRYHLHARRGASAAGDGGGRLCRRPGGAGGGELVAHPAGRAAGARAGLRAGLEPRTALSLPSARKKASRRSSICRSAEGGNRP